MGNRKRLLKCPYCSFEIKATVRKRDKEFKCPNCRRRFYLNQKENLIELKDSKKKLIDFLWRKDKSIYDIRKNLNVSQRRVNQIVTELNHAGLLVFRDNDDGVRMVRLEREKVKVKHETDKFIPEVSFLLVGLIVASIVSVFLMFSYKILFGATFMMVMILIPLLYKIFRTTDITRFFYKTGTKNTNREGVFPKP